MSIAIIAAPSNTATSAVELSINFVKISMDLGEATTLAGLMGIMERSLDNDLELQMPTQTGVLTLHRDADDENYTELLLGGVVTVLLTDSQLRDAVKAIEAFEVELPVAA